MKLLCLCSEPHLCQEIKHKLRVVSLLQLKTFFCRSATIKIYLFSCLSRPHSLYLTMLRSSDKARVRDLMPDKIIACLCKNDEKYFMTSLKRSVVAL